MLIDFWWCGISILMFSFIFFFNLLVYVSNIIIFILSRFLAFTVYSISTSYMLLFIFYLNGDTTHHLFLHCFTILEFVIFIHSIKVALHFDIFYKAVSEERLMSVVVPRFFCVFNDRLLILYLTNIMATCCNRILYTLFLCLWHKILCWNPRPAWLKFSNLTSIFLKSDTLFWFEDCFLFFPMEIYLLSLWLKGH